jgi:hypothetical protein
MSDPKWINADTGAPAYDAAELRRLDSALLFKGVADRFGARQGVHPSNHPAVTVSGTTWTVQHITGVVYPGLSATDGPYTVAHPSESGGLTPADGTNPRIDALDLQIQDDDHDASGFRRARVVYVAGTPAASPTAPAVTANSLRLATILVPAGGSPAPSVQTLAAFTVAAGGVLPLQDGEAFPSSGVHEGMYVDRDEALWRRTGTGFLPAASPNSPTPVVFTSSGSFVKANYPWARRVRVRGQAPGGGGGGAAFGAGQGNSGAGGGGGYFEKWIDVGDLAASVTVTIGAVGSGGSAGNNNGTAGGSVSFGSHATANGGAAGSGSAGSAGGEINTGGVGGTATGGDVNIQGGDGSNGRVFDGLGLRVNLSGSSVLGNPAGITGGGNASGRTGRGFGSGGGSANSSTTNQPGGNGAPGIVIVEVY